MGHAGILPDAKRYSDEVETILLEARRLSRSLRIGEHGRRTAGAGSDFWQFRKFENGLDSPRLINWKQSAKSDGLFVRETEWSAPQTLSIMVDRTADSLVVSVNGQIPDGQDLSWLWDVKFEDFGDLEVKAAGERGADLSVRLTYASIKHQLIMDTVEAIRACPPGRVEVLANYTAFRDLKKFLDNNAGSSAKAGK